jgi:protoheme IX farnesyltransferase
VTRDEEWFRPSADLLSKWGRVRPGYNRRPLRDIFADPDEENETMDAHIAAGTVAGSTTDSRRLSAWLGLYLELAKARLGSLVILTTIVGYVLASRGHWAPWTLVWTVIGTSLTAFGANILNQWWEADRDALMHRTRSRPLPSGRIGSREALRWGLLSSLLGTGVLAAGANLLTAALAGGTVLLYVLVYTPLKVRTPLNTVVGAVVGAVPPMMGWTAATGRVELGAWILFGLLFVWQVPHFLALAWMYRDDYARGGYRMLPAVDDAGGLTGRMAFVWAAALLPLSACLTVSGVTGSVFLATSLALGAAFAWLGLRFARERSRPAARRLFLASVLYLPALLGLMVVDMDDRVARGAFLDGLSGTASGGLVASAPAADGLTVVPNP